MELFEEMLGRIWVCKCGETSFSEYYYTHKKDRI